MDNNMENGHPLKPDDRIVALLEKNNQLLQELIDLLKNKEFIINNVVNRYAEGQLNQAIQMLDLLNKNLSCVVAHLDSFVSLRQAEYSAATRAGLASRGHHQEESHEK